MLGFINVYKPEGITSNAVVQKIKKRFNIKKIGHLGTLDPIACGVLPIAVGKATRLFDYALDKVKTYIVIYDFGYTTDTLDTTGSVSASNGSIPSLTQILNVLPSFIGESDQIPPNFSAKNINGRRAYDLAREGVEFELRPKKINIYDFTFLEQVDSNKFKFKITCSSGTYIRAIGRDLSLKLNTYACMSFLERVETGAFEIGSAIMLDDLLLKQNVDDVLMSPIDVFNNFDVKDIDSKTCTDLRNGIKVNLGAFDKYTFIVCEEKLIGLVKPNDKVTKLDTYLEE